uniref:Ig heavy chain C region, membrane-bound form n=1 Tax=Heterodontus francisci TaxID=7792 RepID=HVCM_HETFR|nr:RecName: Full=Ig heavy chain C region, membrane-bound form; AltName: Full=Clone 3050 [Heterodontus francisci]
ATPSPPTLYGLCSCEQPNTDGSLAYGCLAMDYIPQITSVSWKKDNEPITTGLKTYPSVLNKKGTYTQSSQLTITESEVGSSKIYCEVRRGESVWIKEIPDCKGDKVHPTVILTQSSSEEITSRRFATVLCSIIDFHPESITVSWLKDGQHMESGFVTSPTCGVNGTFSATSRLTVPAREWFTNKVYTCQVSHQGVTQSRNITGSQVPCSCNDPVIKLLPPSIEQVLLEATVTLTCVVSNAPYGVNVSWTQEQKSLKSEIAVQPGEDADSVISTVNISTQAWLSGAEFYCVVNHQDLPTPLRASIHKEEVKDLREPSVSILLSPAEDVSAQRFLSLTCLVRGFFPREIFVKWTVNDKSVNPGNYKNTEVMAENDNSSYFIYSLLSIAAEEWASGASYSCVVGHEAIPLKIINRTVNKSSDSSDHIWIEDNEEESAIDNASTFIILFFLSIFYRAAVTLVKVK